MDQFNYGEGRKIGFESAIYNTLAYTDCVNACQTEANMNISDSSLQLAKNEGSCSPTVAPTFEPTFNPVWQYPNESTVPLNVTDEVGEDLQGLFVFFFRLWRIAKLRNCEIAYRKKYLLEM